MIKTSILAFATLCGLTLAASAQSPAADYPTRTVRIIVSFAPGGGNDAQARLLAGFLQEELGQTFLVDNVAGAGGTIGTNQAARAAPDGYTILTASPSITINPYLQKAVQYNPVKDFDAVIQTTTSPGVLVVNKNSPFKSVKDIIDAAKAKPGEIPFGSSGVGSFSHLSGELFAAKANIKLRHVPYRGTAPAVLDLISGITQMQLENAPGVLGQVRSGELKALAIGTSKPSTIMPGVPLIAETVPGFEASSWLGFVVPAGTPRPIIDKLNAAFNKALADPGIMKKLEDLGVERVGGTPDAFGNYIKAKAEEMVVVAKAAKLEPQ